MGGRRLQRAGKGALGVVLLAAAVGPPAQAAPVNGLTQYRNQVSITYDPISNASFDQVQGSQATLSYSGAAFLAAGVSPGSTVSRSGVTFVWPNTTSGQRDSLSPDGQTIAVDAPPGATSVALLGATHHGPVSTSVALTYAGPDCHGDSTEMQSVAFPDWWQLTAPTAAANEVKSPFLMLQNAVPVPVAVSVFALRVPVDPTRRLVSVGFPSINPAIRVFDLQVPAVAGPAPSPLPCP